MYSTHASDPIPSRRVRISTPTLSPAPLPAVGRQQRNQPAPSCVILRGECSLHHQRFRPVPSSLKQCAGPSISPPTGAVRMSTAFSPAGHHMCRVTRHRNGRGTMLHLQLRQETIATTTATVDEIRKALKANWLRCHPDKVPSELLPLATDLSQRLGEVRATLTDPAQRHQYDVSLNAAPASSSSTAPTHPHSERSHPDTTGKGDFGSRGSDADLRGSYGMWITIPLHRRYNCDPWTIDVLGCAHSAIAART